jgi:hypothetical protein
MSAANTPAHDPDLDPNLSVECPTCHAKPWKHCYRPSGHRIFGGGQHATRVKAAEANAQRPTSNVQRPTREFFIQANSFAAPFFSDTSWEFVTAETPEAALESFAANYEHPCGLYAAACYESADAYHKNPREPLARWLCNHEIEKQRLTKDLKGYSILGHEPGRFEINGKMHVVQNPKAGRLVSLSEPSAKSAVKSKGGAR